MDFFFSMQNNRYIPKLDQAYAVFKNICRSLLISFEDLQKSYEFLLNKQKTSVKQEFQASKKINVLLIFYYKYAPKPKFQDNKYIIILIVYGYFLY